MIFLSALVIRVWLAHGLHDQPINIEWWCAPKGGCLKIDVIILSVISSGIDFTIIKSHFVFVGQSPRAASTYRAWAEAPNALYITRQAYVIPSTQYKLTNILQYNLRH